MIDVGGFEDFIEGEVRVLSLSGREVGIIRWQDQLYALRNLCPHEGGPLCVGRLSILLQASTPGRLELDQASPIITCPWHGWEFYVKTGRAVWGRRYSVRSYPVMVEQGRVLVQLVGHASGNEPNDADG